jgi:hypothetical protein
MLYYLIIASIAGLASVVGILVSLWVFITTATTIRNINFGIDISDSIMIIAGIVFVLCSVNTYILFKGYVAYQNNRLPQAKVYFGIGSILPYGVLLFGIYVFNR